ncbi:pyridoxal kinase [Macrosteles quadrilineatus]|uniref:pyridoxal kinase n=1 Tax=Macrosteles quadrilineatus TaxID=74068 RepID=UPI0023E32D6A|nr:pyridoxal kinase [Macrosteles quadrilineatus]
MSSANYKVLSIQSHVVSGYVGNKSATFPLQVLGFEVDPINSVQFSNHTGYGVFKGQVLNENHLGELVEGLKINQLDQSYTHLLTGYIGSPSFLYKVAEVVHHLKKVCHNLTYICDPVMGDNGAMYVPQDLLPIYRDTIVPLADIVTPNQYELELLTQKPVRSIADAWAAVDWFHEKGIKTVAISSSQLSSNNNQLLALASTMADGKCKRATIEIPLLDATFTGTGDLFAALFLAWMAKSNNNIYEALEKTQNTIQAVLKRTLDYAKQDLKNKKDKPSVGQLELRLIQSKKDIEDVEVLLKAKVIS